jgi:hypothetical protein
MALGVAQDDPEAAVGQSHLELAGGLLVGFATGIRVGRPLGADNAVPRPAGCLVRADAGDLAPARVRVDVSVVAVRLEDTDGGGVGEEPQLVGGYLDLPRLRGQGLGPQEEIGEHRHFRSQLVRWDRGEDEIDGALDPTLTVAELVTGVPGNEDDRAHLGLAPLPDELGRLKAAHRGHAHVEQDHRVILRHDPTQRLLTGVRLDDRIAQWCEGRLQRESLRRIVIDDQDRHGCRAGHGWGRAGRCPGRGRSGRAEGSVTTWSVAKEGWWR